MENALDKVTGVLGVAGSITTLISLAALSILVGYLLARKWLDNQRGVVTEAIQRSDNDALARLLGGTAVPLNDLNADQKYLLATEDLKARGRNRLIGYAFLFFAFLAALAFALLFALNSNSKKEIAPRSLFTTLEVLRFVPVDDRITACAKLLSVEECAQGDELIRSLRYDRPTLEQAEIVEDSVSRGRITQTDLQELAACGGAFRFRVEQNRLLCANGTPVPYVGDDASQSLSGYAAIVFHATGTASQSLASTAQLLAKGRGDLRGPLAHVLISRGGAVVQSAPFNVRANHVGRALPWNGHQIKNSNSIGVELINEGTGQQAFTAEQIAAAGGVAKALVDAYDISVIVGHSDLAPQRRRDPGPLFPMDRVRAEAGAAS